MATKSARSRGRSTAPRSTSRSHWRSWSSMRLWTVSLSKPNQNRSTPQWSTSRSWPGVQVLFGYQHILQRIRQIRHRLIPCCKPRQSMTPPPRLSLGVSGLDSVLKGGLLPGRSYLLRGGPGTGKTILGLHYLRAGVEVGETALYLSFEESPETIVDNAERLGFDVSDVEFLDLTPNGELFDDSRPYSLFEPDEGSTVLFTTQPTAA